MDTGKIKFIIFFILFFPPLIYSQAEYVDVNNKIYSFLERLDALNIVDNYNSFEIPKTRNEIAGYLKSVLLNEDKLDKADREDLNKLRIEFEYDIYKTLERSSSIIGGENYNIFSEEEKYLFYYSEPGKANLFINLLAQGEIISKNDFQNEVNTATQHGKIGGIIRGTLLNKFGFFLKGTQGEVFGNRETALIRDNIKNNFKYRLDPESGFYDETSGYLSADFDLLKFKLGRDRLNIGYGYLTPLVSNNAPVFDYLSLKIKYKFFNFSFFHGKLLGNHIIETDTVQGSDNIIEEKYIVYHRIGFDISKHFKFGLGEIVIYGNRSIDLSYLNPFGFYKSVEHSGQDRDNTMLFFDFINNSFTGLKIFGTLLVDDLAFRKIGTSWYGNKTLLHLGIFSANLYKILPADLRLEYLRIDPYTFTHRLLRNSYTNRRNNIGFDLQPNSELFFIQINYRFSSNFSLGTDFSFITHGANLLNSDGSIKKNVGGDINLGHRLSDPIYAEFLDGDLEYLRKYSLFLSFEPFNQVFIILNMKYINESLQNSFNDEIQAFFTVDVIL